jgi:ABC-type Fe3+-hydroxamate transport system substrate-binding protein
MWRCVLIAILAVSWLGPVGCEPPPPAKRAGPRRVVSMSPAITQMIIDLGMADRLVGVGKMDPMADAEGVTVVGDYNLANIDREKLLAVDPTDLFIQPTREGVPKWMFDLGRRHGFELHAYRQLETIADIRRVLINNAGTGVANQLGVEDVGLALARRIELRLASIGLVVAAERRPRVLLLSGFGPNTTSGCGPETFLGEMLVYAGGRNAIGTDVAQRYPPLDREKILALDPELIVVAHTESNQPPAKLPAGLASLDLPAVTEGRVKWLADPKALLPSTTVPRITAELAKLLHPHLATRIDRALADEPPE